MLDLASATLLWIQPSQRYAAAGTTAKPPADGGVGWTESLILLGSLVALAAIAWGVKWIAARRPWSRHRQSPQALFASLCKLHGLDRRRRRLLARLAASQKLPDPARLFLEPERFDAVNAGPAFDSLREQVEGLRSDLFGQLPPPEGHERGFDNRRLEPALS